MSANWDFDLMAAVRAGDVKEVQRLLQTGEKLDTWGKYGETPLSLAAGEGDLPMMQFLLEAGVDPDEDDYEGHTPIERALWHDHFHAIEFLLNYGTAEARAKRSVDTLLYAASYGSMEMVRRMLQRGVNVDAANARGETAIRGAVHGWGWRLDEEQSQRRAGVVRLLLEAGADVTRRVRGSTVMQMACDLGDVRLVELLRNAGARMELIDAVAIGDLAAVRSLLDHNENPNTPSNERTALGVAAEKGHADITELLLQRGADPFRVGERYEQTPLLIAANAEHTHVVAALLHFAQIPAHTEGALVPLEPEAQRRLTELLLGRGAELNASDTEDLTPLMQAVSHESMSKARLMLQAGADVNATNAFGYTALICAAEAGEVEMVRLLLAAGADVNRVNDNGCTALIGAVVVGLNRIVENARYRRETHEAEQAQSMELVTLFLTAGADVNVQTAYNKTALEYAMESGNAALVRLLRDAGARTAEEL